VLMVYASLMSVTYKMIADSVRVMDPAKGGV
jgi:hypothetical protein